MRTAIVLAAMLFIPAIAFSDTIIVPDDWTEIQDAIDVAVDGDTVLVKPGTYVENIDFLGKAITVVSEQGPDVTIIDGGNSVNPDFASVVIFQNGEGLDSVLDGFTITNGTGTYYPLKNQYLGGGIYCIDSYPTTTGNIITGNTANSGGGISGRPLILNTIIKENKVTHAGGGVYGGAPIIANTIIAWNTASGSSYPQGGGLYCASTSTPVITNSVFYGNSANWGGGGIQATSAAYLTITNTILWNNSAPNGPEIRFYGGSSGTVTYCDVKGGWSGTGNINKNPNFVDAAQGDFHLFYTSPCKDAGNNFAPNISDADFEGDPRIAEGTVDMGADEFHTHLYYTGDPVIGGNVELMFIGLPNSSPVGFWIALDAMEIPYSGMMGDWYLLPPYIGPFSLGAIPSNGVYVLPGTIPSLPPAPYTMYMQALIGGTPMKLSNLCVMDVE